MKACSLDTNCLLALLIPGREGQRTQAQKLLDQRECHVSDLVINELEFVLSRVYELPRAAVVDNIQALLNLESINCNATMFRIVLPLYESHPALSFVDICIATQAQLNRATPLYTSDKKLANQMASAKLLL